MVKGIQLLGMIVGLYLILQTLWNYRKGRFKTIRTFIMIAVWSTMVLFFYNPSFALIILPILSTQDMIMSVLVIGVLGSMVLFTHVWQNVARVEQMVTELVQNLAINDYINKSDYEDKRRDE